MAHDLFMTCSINCSWLVYDLFKTCSWLVHKVRILTFHDLFTTCSRLVHDLFMICSWLVHHFLMTNSWLSILDLFMTCSWLAHDLFPTSWWLVHDLARLSPSLFNSILHMIIHSKRFQSFFLTSKDLISQVWNFIYVI